MALERIEAALDEFIDNQNKALLTEAGQVRVEEGHLITQGALGLADGKSLLAVRLLDRARKLRKLKDDVDGFVAKIKSELSSIGVELPAVEILLREYPNFISSQSSSTPESSKVDLNSIPLEDLNLDVATHKILKNVGVSNAGQVLELLGDNADHLYAVRNIGETRAAHIITSFVIKGILDPERADEIRRNAGLSLET
jgi:hypothetical protein